MTPSAAGHDGTAPPAFAWDWFGRQRMLWREVRRRLTEPAPDPAGPATDPARRTADVPDWDGSRLGAVLERSRAGSPGSAERDYGSLDTRAEFVAALREGYLGDDRIRDTVDSVVIELAFLGRRGGTLDQLGMRTPPRGLRWWWTHLGGADAEAAPLRDDADEDVPVQLRLVDVQAGYGDAAGTFTWDAR